MMEFRWATGVLGKDYDGINKWSRHTIFSSGEGMVLQVRENDQSPWKTVPIEIESEYKCERCLDKGWFWGIRTTMCGGDQPRVPCECTK